jgi:chromosome segregation ATPase
MHSLTFSASMLSQVRDVEDSTAVVSAMQHAHDAKRAEVLALRQHQEVLERIDSTKTRLHELQEQRTAELAARAAASDELGSKRTEIAKLHEKLTAASHQMQSEHAAKAVASAAKLMEARAVRCLGEKCFVKKFGSEAQLSPCSSLS